MFRRTLCPFRFAPQVLIAFSPPALSVAALSVNIALALIFWQQSSKKTEITEKGDSDSMMSLKDQFNNWQSKLIMLC